MKQKNMKQWGETKEKNNMYLNNLQNNFQIIYKIQWFFQVFSGGQQFSRIFPVFPVVRHPGLVFLEH